MEMNNTYGQPPVGQIPMGQPVPGLSLIHI